ncbi:ubiquitin carboxyl-terminal hydrolase (macronuclear) [Tetrahymena thermophila SB210]|uniref:ubiquitinyl hydrolase 1 n=1 Tax=Tetrahymena thermophila (strain SB210) TaxID=312017 RepID=Q23G27_TETTS|nr:ubiquitin carboxyl-terminal hydrolase [Tetrahymena thermophila SB210]EAR95433.2 ubiquitin carboxyl-terminal hydrolase [Tetrahymena thermophila SB210]|eukprot:XP_001015678.2 ubiquitin carboxyl-terminal hydrolase [Tetrahymena thermophila SB210]
MNSTEYTQSKYKSNDELGILSHEAEMIVGKDNQQAFQLLQKALKINEKDPKVNKVMAYYYHYQRMFKQSIQHASRSLHYLKDFSREYNPKKIFADDLFFIGDSYFYEGQYNSAEKAFQQLISTNTQSTDLFTIEQVKAKLQQIEQIKNLSIRESNSSQNYNDNKVAQEFIQKMKECEKNQYMRMHGMPVLLIPNRWFELWKKYVSYQQVQEQLDESHAQSKSSSKKSSEQEKKSRKGSNTSNQKQSDEENSNSKLSDQQKSNSKQSNSIKNDFECEEIDYQYVYPGSIECGEILETYPILNANLGVDPDKVKQFCNLVIKKDAQENSDFVIFPAPVGKVLLDKYGGVRVKRLLLSIQDDTQITQVEIYPMRIDFIVIPHFSSNLNDQIVYKTYINKKETVQNLKQKIFRILSAKNGNTNIISPTVCKLWRCDNQVNYKQLIKSYESRENSQVYINAKLIDNSSCPLDEAEIAEFDLLIVEYRGQDGEWVFQNESERLVVNVCGFCGRKDDDLYYCECQLIRYCNYECQKKHRVKHRNLCQQTKDEQRQKKEILDKFKIKTNRKQSDRVANGVCGLQNLGNTCFMNSALQCLSNVQDLSEFMIQDKFIHDLNKDNPLGTGGYLAASYAELIKDMWRGSDSYSSPWDLKKIIGRFAPQFSGYSQQDSHELLSYLLDGIHEDLNRVKKKPLVNQIESDGQNDLEVALKSWENYQKRNRSIIVDLMVGQFKSTINCPTCNKISVTFDPYMAISVPVPSIAFLSINVYIQFKDEVSLIQTNYNMRGQDSMNDLKLLIAREFKKDPDTLEMAVQDKNLSDFKLLSGRESVETINSQKDLLLFCHERYCAKYDKDIPAEENKRIVLKIGIYTINKRDKQPEVNTYQRIIYIGQNTSYELIHVKVWQIYRFQIAKFVNDNQEIKFKVNLEKDSMEYLLEEYKKFLKFSSNNSLQYQIKINEEITIDFDSSKSLFSEFEQIAKQERLIEINIGLYTQLNEIENINAVTDKTKSKAEYNLYDCLDLFTQKEVLDKGNEWYCNVCKQHKQASKRMEIFDTPKILIIHIKRFRTSRVSSIGNFYFQSGGQKLDDFINFPINGLNLSKYVLSHQYKQTNEPLLYDLFAVSNHYGSMSGGHYTAYAKNPIYNKWFDFNDSSVSESSTKEIVSKAAYVLFYKRREKSVTNY